MDKVKVYAFPNNAGVLSFRCADKVRRQFENGIFVEFRREAILREFDAITLNTWKPDF